MLFPAITTEDSPLHAHWRLPWSDDLSHRNGLLTVFTSNSGIDSGVIGQPPWRIVSIDSLGVKCPRRDLIVLVGESLTEFLNTLGSDIHPAEGVSPIVDPVLVVTLSDDGDKVDAIADDGRLCMIIS
jgi:hypothetical protein